MIFLEFEKPVADLYEQIEKVKNLGATKKIDVSESVEELQNKIEETRKKIYKNLTPWQKVQLSRHAERPYTNYYLDRIFSDFTELHGDRTFADDKAIIGGFAKLNGSTVMCIGHQKGINTKMRQYRNFGMPNPEGYRKALRLMKLAEKFNKPVITFIDTPGAFPGIEAEERGQAEAIARNLFEMSQLKVPIICVVIGEGASGGALGIGVGDRILMLENTWYSVISPESCSSILWRSWDFKETAAEQLRLTSKDMKGFGIVDQIIKEPLGGAHLDPKRTASNIKKALTKNLAELLKLNTDERIEERIDKFGSIGDFDYVKSGSD